MKTTMLSKARAYLAHRHALGFALRIQGYHLLNFARYADGQGHKGPLTNELAVRWACLPKHADRSYWALRLAVIRTFAKHLVLVEPQTQVPPRHLFGPTYRRHPPHLYSAAQIDHLLRRASRLSDQLCARTFQTLLGLLSCTGLRISEALHLRISDVDLDQAFLIIRESKGGRTRLVPMHPTAIPPLSAYARHRYKLFPFSDHFFVSERGTALAYSTVAHTFSELRKDIRHGLRPPRLHDLRHTFACRVLQHWQASRKGAADRVTVLSRFLGHTHVRDTYWYLTAFPQLMAEAVRHLDYIGDETY